MDGMTINHIVSIDHSSFGDGLAIDFGIFWGWFMKLGLQ